jgi:hypothetical protein
MQVRPGSSLASATNVQSHPLQLARRLTEGGHEPRTAMTSEPPTSHLDNKHVGVLDETRLNAKVARCPFAERAKVLDWCNHLQKTSRDSEAVRKGACECR